MNAVVTGSNTGGLLEDDFPSSELGEMPRRPSVPLLTLVALAWWVLGALVYEYGTCISEFMRFVGIVVCLIGALCLALTLRRWFKTRYLRFVVALLLGSALGVASSLIGLVRYEEQALRAQELPSGTYTICAAADARVGGYSNTCSVWLWAEDGSRYKVLLRYSDTSLGCMRYGSKWRAQLYTTEFSSSQEAYYRRLGLVAIAQASSLERVYDSGIRAALVSFRERGIELFDNFESDGAAVLRAIVLGDRSVLQEGSFYASVRAVGLAHLVAVSGAHLAIVCGLVGALLLAVGLPRRATVVLQVLFICAYLLCTAVPISGVRAALMTAVALSALFARRRSSSINALSLCICVLLLLSPQVAVSVTFALSAGATFGIVVLMPLFMQWSRALLCVRARFLHESIALTTSSNVLTLPLSGAVFAQVPLIGPVSNVLILPFFVPLCAGGLCLVVIDVLAGGALRMPLVLLVGLADAICVGIELLAAIPFACIPCDVSVVGAVACSLIVFALLWRMWPQPCLRNVLLGIGGALVFLVLALFHAFGNRATEVIALDVGQGDATVLRSRGACVLIDTGNLDTSLLESLARQGVYSIDYVLITHSDDDHCGSLEALCTAVQVGGVMVAADMLSCTCSSCENLVALAVEKVGSGGVVGLQAGDVISVGAMSLEVVWPYSFTESGGNADSLSVLMRTDFDSNGEAEWSGLFCGDAEDAQLDEMIANGTVEKVDIYKLGHHGSRASIDEETAAVLMPSLVLVSAGENNRYGHPTEEAMAAVSSVGANIYRTDTMGDIVCRLSPNDITVRTQF